MMSITSSVTYYVHFLIMYIRFICKKNCFYVFPPLYLNFLKIILYCSSTKFSVLRLCDVNHCSDKCNKLITL